MFTSRRLVVLTALAVTVTAAIVMNVWQTPTETSAPDQTEAVEDEMSALSLEEGIAMLDECVAILQAPDLRLRDRAQAEAGLRAIGRDQHPLLYPLLFHSSHRVQKAAIDVLGTVGPPAAPVAGRLRRLIDAEDPEIRNAALNAAWRVHADKAPLRPILERVMREGDADLQTMATYLLVQLDPPSLEALFLAAQKSEKPAARRLAQLAADDPVVLARMLSARANSSTIRDALEEHWHALLPAMESIARTHADPEIRLAAIITLTGHQAPQAGDLRNRFAEELLEAASSYRKHPAAEELARIYRAQGHRGKPALKILMESNVPLIRLKAAEALVFVDQQSVEALPVLRSLLSDSSLPTKNALWAIYMLGDAGREAETEVHGFLHDPRPEVARAAREIVRKWDGAPSRR